MTLLNDLSANLLAGVGVVTLLAVVVIVIVIHHVSLKLFHIKVIKVITNLE